MVSLLMRSSLITSRPPPLFNVLRCRFYGTDPLLKKWSEPLRILFCGSDEFSCVSLRALHAEKERRPQLTNIQSIDVLCRPGKPSGRSLRTIREVPIKAVAQELGLPVHERDTFTGWNLPKSNGKDINLIIAVSFGLFVPPRIINSAIYGGLNVHPSLLPAFRGPAPLQHTIINGVKRTGATLQTLDDKTFDNGIILAQTKSPFLEIPDWQHITYDKLLELLAPEAARVLIGGLRGKLYVPPLVDKGHAPDHIVQVQDFEIKHAPKITSEDRKLALIVGHSEGQQIYGLYRALGRLWTNVWVDANSSKRLLFEDITLVDNSKIRPIQDCVQRINSQCPIMDPVKYEEELHAAFVHFMVPNNEDQPRSPLLYVEDYDAIVFPTTTCAVRVGTITIEGQGKMPASKALRSFHRKGYWRLVNTAPKSVSTKGHNLLVESVQAEASQDKMTKETQDQGAVEL